MVEQSWTAIIDLPFLQSGYYALMGAAAKLRVLAIDHQPQVHVETV